MKEKATNMISKDYTLFAAPSILDHKAYCSLNGKADPGAKDSEKWMEEIGVFVGSLSSILLDVK